MINTEGEEINSLDFVLLPNESYILNEVKSEDGVFRTYTNPKGAIASHEDYKGKKTIRMIATTASRNGFNGDGKLLSLVITPKTDEVNLELYAVPGYEGDDTNLVELTEDGDAIDTLNRTMPANYPATEGTCALAQMPEITLATTDIGVVAEEIENIVEDTTILNEENVFDKDQEKNFLENNWIYLAGGLAIIIVALVLAMKPKKKPKVNKKK